MSQTQIRHIDDEPEVDREQYGDDVSAILNDARERFPGAVITNECKFYEDGSAVLRMAEGDAEHAEIAEDLAEANGFVRNGGWFGFGTRLSDPGYRIKHASAVPPEPDENTLMKIGRAEELDLDEPGQAIQMSLSARVEWSEGRIVRVEDLAEGDEVFVEYGQIRRSGGFSYKPYAQEFSGVVEEVDAEAGEVTLDNGIRLTDEGRVFGVSDTSMEDRKYGVKYAIRKGL